MTEHFEPTRFPRHNRFLHALMLESQAWFSALDLGRLMGLHLDERLTRKLDSDQHRLLLLNYHAKIQKTLMISESGVYALMVYHHIPENQHLRRWLTHEVIPTLRNLSTAAAEQGPALSSLQWAGRSVSLLHWQNEPWVKWRDMPVLMQPVEQASVQSSS
ncbi:phage antirepressor [Pseudomonas sp. Ost2]|uniref:BRO-N domain-containing protein n=1 Tax=Pseudomonas sp. Ost2 TaxID=2678260 RepID=UPI001BB455B0|nr:Bro-N domain-containing protein [Pseudomonas sp. Ost2]BBP75686.1 phage antirepressor [Pseudomonas sp. Ost2]